MSYGTLLVAAVALPFSMLFACLSANGRKKITNWLWVAPVPALAAAIFGIWNYPVMLSGPPYHITLMLDASGCMLMLAASLLWIAAGVFVPAFFRGRGIGGSFPLCWLLTLIGSMGIFLAADLASFLVFYALVSLPAYGLVIYDGTPAARRAGAIYIGFALLGENLLLLGFVLLASNDPGGSLTITDLVAGLRVAPWRDVILTLLIAAFGMKIALLPMHFWMPLSYTVLPIPAAAVLSGAAVKAGIIGLIRFLPFDMALSGWGEMLTIVGLFGAFYGVILGITQSDPKTVLAYSSVSQMGFLAALLGMGLAVGDAEAAPIAAFYAAYHILVKGALFLAVGVAAVIGPRYIGLVLFPGAAVALGLAGLPLTGGALAKLAAKVPFGYGLIGVLAACSAAGTALLMLHFLQRVASMASQKATKEAPTPLVIAWLAIALLCVGLPWAAYPMAGLESLSDALAPELIWKTLWPVLVGVGLFIGLRPLLPRLPNIPIGDIAALGESVSRAAPTGGVAIEKLDSVLRLWTPACLMLLMLVILLVLAMAAGV
jgi:multicomponent Na+:H+ antiporter subunit A